MDGRFQAQYLAHLPATFSVSLPWSDFQPLAEVSASADIPNAGAVADTAPVNVSVSIEPLCMSPEPQHVVVSGPVTSPVAVVSVRPPPSLVALNPGSRSRCSARQWPVPVSACSFLHHSALLPQAPPGASCQRAGLRASDRSDSGFFRLP